MSICRNSILILFLILPFLSVTVWSKPLDVRIQTPYAILINAETGAVLYEKNGYERIYPASTTKIATMLYALKLGIPSMDKMVLCSNEALKRTDEQSKKNHNYALPAYWLEKDGTMEYLRSKEIVSLEMLFHALMLNSANDAANVLAEHLGGDIPTFMEGLNEFLSAIGCKSTHFTNPHGLYHPDHFSTAYDMAMIMRAALQYDEILAVMQKESYDRPKSNLRPEGKIPQNNRLMKPSNEFFYPKALGGKTGYVRMAGYNLVTVARDKDRTLIAALHKSSDRNQRFRDAILLFDAAFAENKESRVLFAHEETLFSRKLQEASSPLEAGLYEDLIWEYYPSEEVSISSSLHWSNVNLPLSVGDKVGSLMVHAPDGRLLIEAPLYCLSAVKMKWSVRVLRCIETQKMLFTTLSMFIAAFIAITIWWHQKKRYRAQ